MRLGYHIRRMLTGRVEPTRSRADLLHTNSIQILDRDVPALRRRGDATISIRNLDMIAVVDLGQHRIVWSWGPAEVENQHQPTLLDNGHLLVFDNGPRSPHSWVIALDPETGKVVWQYTADPPEAFFSHIKGGYEKLPNGNSLIAELERGRVIQATPEGDVVWEFFNPDVNEEEQTRASIYRMTRLRSGILDAVHTGTR